MPLPDNTIGLSVGGSVRPPRQPTFLVHYERKFKVGIVLTVGALLLLGVPLAHMVFPSHVKHVVTVVQSADRVTEAIVPPLVVSGGGEDVAATAESPTISPAALNDQDDRSLKLLPAPLPGLSQETPEGSLPRISEDGLQPWQSYARPFNAADQRPRIALVIMNIGMSRLPSDAAINRLPTNITMAIDSQSQNAKEWCDRARQNGHETVLALPMEPFDYPRSDPGPHTLLTSQSNSDNLIRLLWGLRQASGYVGVTTLTGSRFTTDPEKLTPILDELHKRGLMIFDAHVAPHSVVGDLAHNIHMPVTTSAVTLDLDPSPLAIDTALNQLEKNARINGAAIAIASTSPTTLDRLEVWLKDLPQRGIALAPLSAMVK